MPITEEKAITILEGLIRKPETKTDDIPRIWSELIRIYNAQFAPVEEPKKKRRRRTAGAAVGWPAGVSRAEFKAWKESQQQKGVTEGLNPQEYKRQRDAGELRSQGLEFFRPGEKKVTAKIEKGSKAETKKVPTKKSSK